MEKEIEFRNIHLFLGKIKWAYRVFIFPAIIIEKDSQYLSVILAWLNIVAVLTYTRKKNQFFRVKKKFRYADKKKTFLCREK